VSALEFAIDQSSPSNAEHAIVFNAGTSCSPYHNRFLILALRAFEHALFGAQADRVDLNLNPRSNTRQHEKPTSSP
jgi:hypothetical protein